MTYSKHFSNSATPQSKPLIGREADMEKNAAGGFVFSTDSWQKLRRFLVIGAEGGTYYEGERELTIKNAANVIACIKENGLQVVGEIVRVSDSGAAPSNSPAIFALALVFVNGDVIAKRAASDAVVKVCRTGTHLFEFIETVKQLGKNPGAGATLPRGIAAWYLNQKPRDLAYQVTKYANRNSWTHRDVLRMVHINPGEGNSDRDFVFQYIMGKDVINVHNAVEFGSFKADRKALQYLFGVEAAKQANEDMLCDLIAAENLPREVIPTPMLNSVKVWRALLEKMPYTAMLRNLPKMTRLGMFDTFSPSLTIAIHKLTDAELIHKSRVHPLQLLVAERTYASGHSDRGSSTWTPNQAIIAALQEAFIKSFDNVEPISKNIMVSVDVSGSMDQDVAGFNNLSTWEAAAAVCLVHLKAQPNAHITYFSDPNSGVHQANIHSGMSLAEATRAFRAGGGTDLSQPILYAMNMQLPVDGIMIITDNETWAGHQHPSEALKALRRSRPEVRLVNVMVAATSGQVHDPKDMRAMEMAGFTPSMFTVANSFFNGDL